VCAVFSALALWRASSFALRSWSVMFEGSGMWEIPLSSSWWCSSSISYAVASWVVFRLNHGGRRCWGVRKSDEVPEHKSQEHKSKELRNGDK
jgi:hypothetical protein